MFRLSSRGHHQVVSHYRGKYTIYGMIRYVTIKIIMIQRDLVLSIKASNNVMHRGALRERDGLTFG